MTAVAAAEPTRNKVGRGACCGPNGLAVVTAVARLHAP